MQNNLDWINKTKKFKFKIMKNNWNFKKKKINYF